MLSREEIRAYFSADSCSSVSEYRDQLHKMLDSSKAALDDHENGTSTLSHATLFSIDVFRAVYAEASMRLYGAKSVRSWYLESFSYSWK
mgnify:CR=1 FL=1